MNKLPITMKHEGIHKAKTINIKVADIDTRMIPIVQWLNAYESVMTVGCCEGDKKENLPQVSFICCDSLILSYILRDIYEFNDAQPTYKEKGFIFRKGTIDVGISYMPTILNPIVYSVNFMTTDVLDNFIRWRRL